ncbi:hypothetical protein HUJ05_008478 [Dendroctonus ponderosae]|nr:hypothetical protein HUJ05_008478 [Dendroctonus ponderosae]
MNNTTLVIAGQMRSLITQTSLRISGSEIINQATDLDLLEERAAEISKRADESNRKNIQQQAGEATKDWSSLVSNLEGRRDTLTKLAEVWASFEEKWQRFESGVSGIEERAKHIDQVVRNRDHVIAAKNEVEALHSEAVSLKPQEKEVLEDSKLVLHFLEECSPTSASALSKKLDQLTASFQSGTSKIGSKARSDKKLSSHADPGSRFKWPKLDYPHCFLGIVNSNVPANPFRVEQQLRAAMAPNYKPHERDEATREQEAQIEVCRQRITILISQIRRVDPNAPIDGPPLDVSYAEKAAGRAQSKERPTAQCSTPLPQQHEFKRPKPLPRKSRSPRRRPVKPADQPMRKQPEQLAPPTVRARSKSPMWVPGCTTYAEVLRNQMASKALEAQAQQEAPPAGLPRGAGKRVEPPELVEPEHSPAQHQQEYPNEPQYQPPVSQYIIQAPVWNPYQQVPPYELHPTYGPGYYPVAQQPNILEYIQPMPDMVNFIASGQQLMSSGLGTYHAGVAPAYALVREQTFAPQPVAYQYPSDPQPLEAPEPAAAPIQAVEQEEEASGAPAQEAVDAPSGSHFSYAQALSQGLSDKPLQPSSITANPPTKQRSAPRQLSPTPGYASTSQDEAMSHAREDPKRPHRISSEKKSSHKRPKRVEPDHSQQLAYRGEPNRPLGGKEAVDIPYSQDLKAPSDIDSTSQYIDKDKSAVKVRKLKCSPDTNTQTQPSLEHSSKNKPHAKEKTRKTKPLVIQEPVFPQETKPESPKPDLVEENAASAGKAQKKKPKKSHSERASSNETQSEAPAAATTTSSPDENLQPQKKKKSKPKAEEAKSELQSNAKTSKLSKKQKIPPAEEAAQDSKVETVANEDANAESVKSKKKKKRSKLDVSKAAQEENIQAPAAVESPQATAREATQGQNAPEMAGQKKKRKKNKKTPIAEDVSVQLQEEQLVTAEAINTEQIANETITDSSTLSLPKKSKKKSKKTQPQSSADADKPETSEKKPTEAAPTENPLNEASAVENQEEIRKKHVIDEDGFAPSEDESLVKPAAPAEIPALPKTEQEPADAVQESLPEKAQSLTTRTTAEEYSSTLIETLDNYVPLSSANVPKLLPAGETLETAATPEETPSLPQTSAVELQSKDPRIEESLPEQAQGLDANATAEETSSTLTGTLDISAPLVSETLEKLPTAEVASLPQTEQEPTSAVEDVVVFSEKIWEAQPISSPNMVQRKAAKRLNGRGFVLQSVVKSIPFD